MIVLAPGALAPSFLLPSIDGPLHTLEAHRGRRVLLAFLRNARCAVCNLWVRQTARRAAAWREAGLDVIVVFESTPEALRAQFAEWAPPFVVLADADGRVHDAFGSRSDAARVREVVQSGAGAAALARAEAEGIAVVHEDGANFFRLPAEVLVERDGTIARLHVAEDVANHLDPAEIDAFARLAAAPV
jgi:peroxiredoxin